MTKRPLQSLPPARQAKVWARLKRLGELRLQPGHCRRCARPWQGKLLTCDICRSSQAEKRQSFRDEKLLAEIKSQVCMELQRFRRELEKIQKRQDGLRVELKRRYARGFQAGKAFAQKIARFDDLPVVSRQEIATLNHAFEHEK